MKFNRLTVIRRAERDSRKIYWECKCDCGNIKVVAGSNLKNGSVKSCGCARKGIRGKDLASQRFGRLVALYSVGTNKHNQVLWHCKCDCGNFSDVVASKLIRGKTKSCGCYVGISTSKRSLIEMQGKRIGKWTILYRDYEAQAKSANGKTVYWKCRCDCGVERSVSATSLRYGDSLSCGCGLSSFAGSKEENEIKDFVSSIVGSSNVTKKSRILDGKEIDIFVPHLNIGIEFNGSFFHSSCGTYKNKDKYYHMNKFLCAKNLGIHLISIFEEDYKNDTKSILNYLSCVLRGNLEHKMPDNDIVYTDNDFDDGVWLYDYGYHYIGQLEPPYYLYRNKYIVYRSGVSVWLKDNTEVTDEIANRLISTVEHRAE